MKKLFSILFMFFLTSIITYAQTKDLNPGIARWNIKTSTVVDCKTVPIGDLLRLENPVDNYVKSEYGNKRIPNIVQTDNIKEGYIVIVIAWLYPVALIQLGFILSLNPKVYLISFS